MMKGTSSPILVLGSGAWGSALAIHLARLHHSVILWGHDQQEIEAIKATRYNQLYLPAIPFPDNIQLSSNLSESFKKATPQALILMVVPSFCFEDMTKRIQPFLTPESQLVWATKGLSEEGILFHEICLKNCGDRDLAVLSGPSFAKEVAMGLPTAVTIAANHASFSQSLSRLFHSERFRVYLSDDLIGVQLGGAIKNVLAIAVGMSDGLGFGANARSALITRGLAELCRLGEKCGAQSATMMGLAGIGDIVLTCTDNQSRNRRFGLALGQGKPAKEALAAIGQVVEGYMNVKQVQLLSAKHQVEMPICAQVHAVLFENCSVERAVDNLLMRTPKPEGI